MELPATHNKITTSLSTETTLGIDQEDFAHIFTTLSSKLYSDPWKATITELCSNAFDAHIDADISDHPFEVILPALGYSELVVRDYGIGMSHEIFETYYMRLGKSTKRNSNKTIGAFGLGRFAAFSVLDNYQIETCDGITKRRYIIALGTNGLPFFNMLSSEDCNDRGTSVYLNVPDPKTLALVRSKIESILPYFDVAPVLKRQSGEILSYKNKNIVLETDEYVILDDVPCTTLVNPVGVLYGNTIYPIALDLLGMGSSSIFANVDSAFVPFRKFLIKIPLGSISIPGNREQIVYNDPTKKVLQKALLSLEESILGMQKDFLKDFNNKTLQEIRDFCYAPHVKSYMSPLLFGHTIDTISDPVLLSNAINISISYRKVWRGNIDRSKNGKLDRITLGNLVYSKFTFIVDQDGITHRQARLKDMEHAYLVSREDADTFIKSGHILANRIKFINISDLPYVPVKRTYSPKNTEKTSTNNKIPISDGFYYKICEAADIYTKKDIRTKIEGILGSDIQICSDAKYKTQVQKRQKCGDTMLMDVIRQHAKENPGYKINRKLCQYRLSLLGSVLGLDFVQIDDYKDYHFEFKSVLAQKFFPPKTPIRETADTLDRMYDVVHSLVKMDEKCLLNKSVRGKIQSVKKVFQTFILKDVRFEKLATLKN